MAIDLPPILIDTREPAPHPWECYFSCETVRGTLQTGDFSLPGCEEFVACERKTLDDLIACLCSSRDRFTKELQRAQRIKDFVIIVESSYADVLKGNYRSAMNPKSAWESILALQQRFGIPFLMAGSTDVAARLCQSYLHGWFREHTKIIEQARLAARRIQKSA